MFGTRSALASAMVVMLWGTEVPALAQEADDQPDAVSESPLRLPIEVGVGIDGVASLVTNGGDVRLSISFPRSERVSFELFGGMYSGGLKEEASAFVLGSNVDVRGIYGFQIKQNILSRRRGRMQPFMTYGAMGVLTRTTECGVPACRPAKSIQFVPPALGLLGVGIQHSMSPRLALRVEAQGGFFLVIPVGLRGAVSLSIPLGPIASSSSNRSSAL